MLRKSHFLVFALLFFLITEKKCEDKVPKSNVLNKYVDVFRGSQGGKPTLGSTKSTCWARGGTCMHISLCPSLRIDTQVTGCTTAFMVCCKNFLFGSPTVGILRTPAEIPIYSSNFEELEGESTEIMATRNAELTRQVR